MSVGIQMEGCQKHSIEKGLWYDFFIFSNNCLYNLYSYINDIHIFIENL